MKVTEAQIAGVLLLEPSVFPDERGRFLETWNRRRYEEVGIPECFVQDNASYSRQGVLRGLHYQEPHRQGKLVSALFGAIWDVAVDIRQGSPTFGGWVGYTLSAENAHQLWIPEGFAHGFVVLSEEAVVQYKCTEVYHPEAEVTIRWDDPELSIDWPVGDPIISPKDLRGCLLREIPAERLPKAGSARALAAGGDARAEMHSISDGDPP